MNGRPPLIHASLGLHVFSAGLLTVQASWWPYVAATLIADHLVLVGAGLVPTSAWLGPNLRRLPEAARMRREVTLTIDDGPDPDVTPRVLDALDALSMKATFFCIGQHVAAHPALARAIVARGHTVENHSHAHRHDFSVLLPHVIEREVVAAQRAIADATGIEPSFFRAPAGLRNVFLQPVLARHGLALTSWTRRGFDTVRRDPARVTARLVDGLAAGDMLLVHDGHAARTTHGTPVVLDVLPAVARAIDERGLVAVTLAKAMR